MKKKEIDERDKILQHLKNDSRSLLWLCNSLKINYNTMYHACVLKKFNLTPKKREAINQFLGTSY